MRFAPMVSPSSGTLDNPEEYEGSGGADEGPLVPVEAVMIIESRADNGHWQHPAMTA
jgi:hypothetical protein